MLLRESSCPHLVALKGIECFCACNIRSQVQRPLCSIDSFLSTGCVSRQVSVITPGLFPFSCPLELPLHWNMLWMTWGLWDKSICALIFQCSCEQSVSVPKPRRIFTLGEQSSWLSGQPGTLWGWHRCGL